MADEDKGKVKITDKRRFTEGGESRAAEARSEETPKEKEKEHEKGEKEAVPPIDFLTFVLSLASSAQVHLGLIPNPVTGKPEKSLDLAKQTIDILGVLQEKTKGNLTKDEERLLEGVLYDLRMKYVELNA